MRTPGEETADCGVERGRDDKPLPSLGSRTRSAKDPKLRDTLVSSPLRARMPRPWDGLGLGQWHIWGLGVVDLAAGGQVVGEELKVAFLLKMCKGHRCPKH